MHVNHYSSQAAPHSVLSLMPYVVPILEERLSWAEAAGAITSAAAGGGSSGGPSSGTNGGRSPREPSEEIRVMLADQLLVLLKLAAKAVSAYAAEVVQVCGGTWGVDVCGDGEVEVQCRPWRYVSSFTMAVQFSCLRFGHDTPHDYIRTRDIGAVCCSVRSMSHTCLFPDCQGAARGPLPRDQRDGLYGSAGPQR